MQIVVIDARRITDWNSFHDVFAEAFGFPSYYGRNMNAWIDCLTYLSHPDGNDTAIHANKGEVVVLCLEHANEFAQRCPEHYAAVVECSAFVNYRLIEKGDPPALALAWRD